MKYAVLILILWNFSFIEELYFLETLVEEIFLCIKNTNVSFLKVYHHSVARTAGFMYF